jgi:hypothetical protein
MFEYKACKHNYADGDAKFVAGMKVTTVKQNHRVERRGPTGVNQPKNAETSIPTWKEDKCPFKTTFV